MRQNAYSLNGKAKEKPKPNPPTKPLNPNKTAATTKANQNQPKLNTTPRTP